MMFKPNNLTLLGVPSTPIEQSWGLSHNFSQTAQLASRMGILDIPDDLTPRPTQFVQTSSPPTYMIKGTPQTDFFKEDRVEASSQKAAKNLKIGSFEPHEIKVSDRDSDEVENPNPHPKVRTLSLQSQLEIILENYNPEFEFDITFGPETSNDIQIKSNIRMTLTWNPNSSRPCYELTVLEGNIFINGQPLKDKTRQHLNPYAELRLIGTSSYQETIILPDPNNLNYYPSSAKRRRRELFGSISSYGAPLLFDLSGSIVLNGVRQFPKNSSSRSDMDRLLSPTNIRGEHRMHFPGFRERMLRKKTSGEFVSEEPVAPPIPPLQRQFIDLVRKRSSRGTFVINVGSDPNSDLHDSNPNAPLTYMTLEWVHEGGNDWRWAIVILSTENISFSITNNQPIKDTEGQKHQLYIRPIDTQIEITSPTSIHTIRLLNPLIMRDTYQTIREAYNFFDLDLDSVFKSAQHTFRKALMQVFKQCGGDDTTPEFKKTIEKWNLICLYNDW